MSRTVNGTYTKQSKSGLLAVLVAVRKVADKALAAALGKVSESAPMVPYQCPQIVAGADPATFASALAEFAKTYATDGQSVLRYREAFNEGLRNEAARRENVAFVRDAEANGLPTDRQARKGKGKSPQVDSSVTLDSLQAERAKAFAKAKQATKANAKMRTRKGKGKGKGTGTEATGTEATGTEATGTEATGTEATGTDGN